MTDTPPSAAAPEHQPRPYSLWLVLLASAILYVVFYGPTLVGATFLNDDWYHIEPLPRDRIIHLFYGDWVHGYGGGGGFYRPLPRVLMQLARRGFDLHAPLYLMVSAGFHLVNCLLVWLLAMRLSQRARVAWAAALLFAVYPTHPEALLLVSTWPDLMATCGCLIALNGYLRLHETHAPRHWLAALAGVALGALSKESWVTLPLMMLLVEFVWPSDPARRWPDAKAWRRVVVFFVLSAIYAVFRHLVLGGVGGYGFGLTPKSVVQTFNGVFQMVIFPFAAIGRWRGLVNIFTLLVAMIVVWLLLGRARLLLFATGWMVLTSLPLLTLVPALNNGGRLVYLTMVGWALFLGGVFDALVRAGQTASTRRAIGVIVAVVVGGPLLVTLALRSNDWHRSFIQNHRLVSQMVATAAAQPAAAHYAVLDWPLQFGMALSNRPDTAAKALSMLAGIHPSQVDRILAPDAPSSTITFEPVDLPRPHGRSAGKTLRVGRATRLQTWQWSGDRLEPWHLWQKARLVQTRPDGSRDYAFDDPGDGLAGPELAGSSGAYTILICYQPLHLDRGAVMWREPDRGFQSSRTAILHPLPRLGSKGQVAYLGPLAGLQQLVFFPSSARGELLTLHSLELARFDIQPLAPTKEP